MPALSARNLRKSFGPQVVLDDATFTLARGEKVALIGANGAGKSTLARILAGIDAPDAGSVTLRRGISVSYVSQEPELDADRTAREVVEDALSAWRAATTRYAEVGAALGNVAADQDALLAEQAELDDTIHRLGGWDRGHAALAILQQLGVSDVDRPCGTRSGGERRRIALARVLVASPDVAILDEPTNHLDADTAEWLEKYLADDFVGALVLVTHDRYFLDAVAERIIELERGRLIAYRGGYSEYLDAKAELMAQEERVEQNRQNALRREREWLARGPKARGTKQKARIQRAHALEAQAPATSGRSGEVSLLGRAVPRQGKTILDLRAVQVCAADGTPALNEPFDRALTAGERVGIVGPNGVGKTSLLRSIVALADEMRGEMPERAGPCLVSGEITVGRNTRVGYLDQARAGLDDDASVFDDVRGEGGSTVIDLGVRGREQMDLRSYLELFLFDAQKQRQKVGSLSGGERARVALAKLLRQETNLLLLDEPTNDLDLPTLASLEELLEAYAGSVLVVTHDRAFLDHVATGILAFQPRADGGPANVTAYAGGYTDYVSQREARSRSEATRARAAAQPPSETSAKPRASKGGLTHAERIELESIVEAIDEAARQIASFEAELADPTLYATRGQEVAALNRRIRDKRAEEARLVERWEALESKRS
jgi:ATP-binding cassette subfamily F protein uup